MTWRMPTKCSDCPFADDGPGIMLRHSLRPNRWGEIIKDMMSGKHFICHKTSKETGNGNPLICAGSIEWQHEHGIVSQFETIMRELVK